jgi:hypothetical protein
MTAQEEMNEGLKAADASQVPGEVGFKKYIFEE